MEALVITVDKTTERLKKKVVPAQELATVATTLTIKKLVNPPREREPGPTHGEVDGV